MMQMIKVRNETVIGTRELNEHERVLKGLLGFLEQLAEEQLEVEISTKEARLEKKCEEKERREAEDIW